MRCRSASFHRHPGCPAGSGRVRTLQAAGTAIPEQGRGDLVVVDGIAAQPLAEQRALAAVRRRSRWPYAPGAGRRGAGPAPQRRRPAAPGPPCGRGVEPQEGDAVGEAPLRGALADAATAIRRGQPGCSPPGRGRAGSPGVRTQPEEERSTAAGGRRRSRWRAGGVPWGRCGAAGATRTRRRRGSGRWAGFEADDQRPRAAEDALGDVTHGAAHLSAGSGLTTRLPRRHQGRPRRVLPCTGEPIGDPLILVLDHEDTAARGGRSAAVGAPSEAARRSTNSAQGRGEFGGILQQVEHPPPPQRDQVFDGRPDRRPPARGVVIARGSRVRGSARPRPPWAIRRARLLRTHDHRSVSAAAISCRAAAVAAPPVPLPCAH